MGTDEPNLHVLFKRGCAAGPPSPDYSMAANIFTNIRTQYRLPEEDIQVAKQRQWGASGHWKRDYQVALPMASSRHGNTPDRIFSSMWLFKILYKFLLTHTSFALSHGPICQEPNQEKASTMPQKDAHNIGIRKEIVLYIESTVNLQRGCYWWTSQNDQSPPVWRLQSTKIFPVFFWVN